MLKVDLVLNVRNLFKADLKIPRGISNDMISWRMSSLAAWGVRTKKLWSLENLRVFGTTKRLFVEDRVGSDIVPRLESTSIQLL